MHVPAPLMLPTLVDAHVGRSLFHNAILSSVRTRGKTVILVTHALHFISYCDGIYMMENGRIKEHGRYQELADKEGDVARLVAEFGGGTNDSDSVSDKSSDTIQDDSIDEEKQRSKEKTRGAAGTGRLEGRLIVKERRTTGSLSGKGSSLFVCQAITAYAILQCTGNTLAQGVDS